MCAASFDLTPRFVALLFPSLHHVGCAGSENTEWIGWMHFKVKRNATRCTALLLMFGDDKNNAQNGFWFSFFNGKHTDTQPCLEAWFINPVMVATVHMWTPSWAADAGIRKLISGFMAMELQMGSCWGSESSLSCRMIYVDHLSLSVDACITFKSCPAFVFVHLSSFLAC